MSVFLISAISIATVLLFGCVGEIITEKAGHLNLGIPGIMCMGTAGGCLGVSLYMGALSSPENASWILLVLISILFSVVFAAALGAVYALLTVTLRCNQNITGLAITIFGGGATNFIMSFVDRTHFDPAGKLISTPLPFADSLGVFGQVVLGHGVFVYLAIAIAIACAIVLNKTRVGLHLRAVGESPATADAAGINVTAYKYVAILSGSAIAGLGGFYYIMDYIKGSWENASTIEGFGWLAIALVIFVLWKPNFGILGAFLFGACYIVAFVISGITSTQKEIIKMLPYVITIVVLVITSARKNRENQPPASLGLPYFREDR
ncbi:MAG: ABC transporter permease [Clostridia bacterium]|nr:ABC transporter permease [Clostridia bacterium]MBQ9735153.1 ABC transporter permease [Clostridia bacterium]